MRAVPGIEPACLFFCLAVFSAAIGAEETEPCAGLEGSALSQCRSNQQTMRLQQQLEQQLQQQQQREDQLDQQQREVQQQQREVQQQLESMRLQNESLRKQLEAETANQAARPVATSSTDAAATAAAKSGDLKSWKAANPWFGSDYPKTQFAMHYLKQLQKERPDLTGRELLDTVSTKVNETFLAKR
jgi:TolA-binding protein